MNINRRNLFTFTLALAIAVTLPLPAHAENNDGWFGVEVKVNTKGISFNPKIRSVKITKVFPSSPAAAVGIVAGDSVVVIQGVTVAGARGNDLRAVMKKAVGEEIKIKIKRGAAEPYEVKMTAVKKPSGV